jgi:hypothetical protein
LCRYIKPLAPPEDIFSVDRDRKDPTAIEKAARYVSLIPVLEDSQMF